MMDKAVYEAIEFEKRGYEVYKDIANKTDNLFVKKVFLYLSEQEKYHVEAIEKWVDSREIEIKSDSFDNVLRFFNYSVDEFRDKVVAFSDGDLNSQKMAMDMEMSSYNFYKDKFESAEDEDEKEFYKFLMEQENLHYKMIEQTFMFLKNPLDYHVNNEEWIMEG
jgi:rubrerythrin